MLNLDVLALGVLALVGVQPHGLSTVVGVLSRLSLAVFIHPLDYAFCEYRAEVLVPYVGDVFECTRTGVLVNLPVYAVEQYVIACGDYVGLTVI